MNGKKKPYFANNWQMYKDADADMFLPHTYEEVMDYKIAGWELPSSVNCIIRTTHLETKKVEEHVYKRRHAAENKIKQLLNSKTHDLCITTHDAQHYIGPRPEDHDDEELQLPL